MSEAPAADVQSISESDLYEKWSHHPFKVGEFTVDLNEKLVESPDGDKRNITPNSIKLLLLLIHNEATYVSLNDIHKFIYGNQYKDDSSIRKQVTVLRKLFDDTEKEKFYIENKLGHGYRLIAPVKTTEWRFEGSDNKSFTTLIIITLALLLVVVTTYFLMREDNGAQPVNLSTPKPLTHLEGLEFYPSFSPDGKWMLFNHLPHEQSKWEIWVRNMESGDLIKLSPDVTASDYRVPRWTGEEYKFIYSEYNDGTCYFTESTFDPNNAVITDSQKLVKCSFSSLNATNALWKDGKGIYFNKAESINAPFVIYSHSFSSGESWPIASPPPSGKGDYYFSLSPHKEKMAVLRNKNGSQTEVWIYDVNSWETKLVDTVNQILITVTWTSSGDSILYRNDSNQIIEFEIAQKRHSVKLRPAVPVMAPEAFGDKSISVSVGSYFRQELTKHNLKDNEAKTLINSSYNDFMPAVSFDGNTLAWISNRTGVFQVWIMHPDGRKEQVTHLKNNLEFIDLSFSPSGDKLGGTASGRWFVIDVNSKNIHWGPKDKYFKNFQWKRTKDMAYVAVKHMEQWEQAELNTVSADYKLVDTMKDAFIVLEDRDLPITYIANFKQSGFWRVHGEHKKYIQVDEPINQTRRWVTTKDGLYFVSKQKLMFLANDSEQAVKLDIELFGNEVSAPYNNSWLVTTKKVEGEVDLNRIE
ncbi:winged helix-turn-helix domain-containing protein [Pleionea sediminis]|uniref:winged helix-turn-helix domain-containing protein n=1 Tax=Pleionea sediminis TaxID=2569479 RepID=UPI001185E64D|nr:winged helix-turn-helix domain-containing protein [Pleionea sediminis]